MIDIDSLVDRRVYRIHSRNLVIGAWNAKTNGFIGIREKFGSRYLSTEYEHDFDSHVGTARAVDDLGVDVPTNVEMREHLPETLCNEHGKVVSWAPDEVGGRVGKWKHDDDGTLLEPGDWPQTTPNQALFDLLERHEARAHELREAEIERFQREHEAREAAMTPEEKAERERQHQERMAEFRAERERRRKAREEDE